MTGRLRVLSVLLVLAAVAPPPHPARAENLRFNEAEARHEKDEPTSAKRFSSGVLTLLIPLTDLLAPDTEIVEVRCAAHAGVSGVKVDFLWRYFDADRNLLGETSERARTGDDGWTPGMMVPPLIEGAPPGSLLWANARPRGGKRTDAIKIRCVYAPGSFCDGSTEEVCS